MRLLIINGPNLNLLAHRDKKMYGGKSFEKYMIELSAKYPAIEFDYFQSNVEGELINTLHEYGMKKSKEKIDGIIMNPGGYSHTSVSLADAVEAIDVGVVEVHISNIYAREEFRHQSLTGAKSLGVITGFGLNSYQLAVDYFKSLVKKR
jgi:3-dehydroquinate dehydratase II